MLRSIAVFMKEIEGSQRAFTLVEVMIVVAVLAMLAAIAIPSFVRARKRAQASSTLESLRMIAGAKEQYAIENSKGGSLTPEPADLVPYVKNGTRLYTDLLAGQAMDAIGNPMTINTLDQPPKVSPTTRSALADALGVNADEFWEAYK